MAHTTRLALIDELTGLPNRRSISATFAAEVARSRAGAGAVTVAIADLDRFKFYNDTYGHEAGDRILVEVAAALRESLRDADSCGRFGGDEFLLVFSRTEEVEAIPLVERIRCRVEAVGRSLSAAFPGGRLSLSAGVATLRPEHGDACELLRRADRALYAAKQSGRNRVCRLANRGEADAR